jgi:hypothetical protein
MEGPQNAEFFALSACAVDNASYRLYFVFRDIFVRIDMKSAMKALAQIKQGHAVHVIIIPALGTSGDSRQGYRHDKQDKPDKKNRHRSAQRMSQLQGQPHRRHIDQDQSP